MSTIVINAELSDLLRHFALDARRNRLLHLLKHAFKRAHACDLVER
jgi:hypothetical protein